jgi:dTMP kinase
MNDEERLEKLQDVLDRLSELSEDHVILVEGNKDVSALANLNIRGDIYCVQSGGGPVKAAEYVWRSGKEAVILTDWDGRGGNLAHSLRENLRSLGVGYDDSIRSDLAFLTRMYSKDVESLDSVFGLLEERSESVQHP